MQKLETGLNYLRSWARQEAQEGNFQLHPESQTRSFLKSNSGFEESKGG